MNMESHRRRGTRKRKYCSGQIALDMRRYDRRHVFAFNNAQIIVVFSDVVFFDDHV